MNISIESGDVLIKMQAPIYKSIFDTIEEINPYVSSDYHLLKELMPDFEKGEKPNEENLKGSLNIIESHNSVIGKDDVFLFLGDLSESEYLQNSDYVQLIVKYASSLNGKKYMIKGNNDTLTKEFYKKECGFIDVFEEGSIQTKDFIFSHYPVPIIGNRINVHGHIHGTKNYWGVNPKDHVDAYIGLYGKPIKLSKLKSLNTNKNNDIKDTYHDMY